MGTPNPDPGNANRIVDDGQSPEWKFWFEKHRTQLFHLWDNKRAANRAFHYAMDLATQRASERKSVLMPERTAQKMAEKEESPMPCEMLVLRAKRLDPRAILPTKAHSDDACFDIYVIEDVDVPPFDHTLTGNVNVRTGLAFQLPVGYWMDVRPRSGLGFKGTLIHLGTLDEGYRGELKIKLFNITREWIRLRLKNSAGVPDRIAQMRLVKNYDTQIVEVENLSESLRGMAGFGSSGGTPEFGPKCDEG